MRGRVRKLGNSLGVVIQSELAKSEGLAEGDEVELEVKRRVSIKELFGTMKFGETTQAIKDKSRLAWGE